jgi:opacity protein-like surface antigen
MITSRWYRAALLTVAAALAFPAEAQLQPYSSSASAPQKRTGISVFGGYQLNGDVDAYAGKLVVDDAATYGAAVDVAVGGGATAQLLWIYSPTTAKFTSYDPFYPSSRDFDVDVHYFQIGGTRGVRRGKAEPFGGATLGAVVSMPSNVTLVNGSTVETDDNWNFAMTFGAGVKIHASEKVAVRLEARLLLPMIFSGGSFYVGTGGSGMAVSAGVPSIQGAFTAGITFSP